MYLTRAFLAGFAPATQGRATDRDTAITTVIGTTTAMVVAGGAGVDGKQTDVY